MARTLTERAKDVWWWLEQAAHFGIGSISAAMLSIGSPILAGVLAALWVALMREYEQRPVNSWGDLVVDVAATALGGLFVGLVVWGGA